MKIRPREHQDLYIKNLQTFKVRYVFTSYIYMVADTLGLTLTSVRLILILIWVKLT